LDYLTGGDMHPKHMMDGEIEDELRGGIENQSITKERYWLLANESGKRFHSIQSSKQGD
jgi:hypothetical protein